MAIQNTCTVFFVSFGFYHAPKSGLKQNILDYTRRDLTKGVSFLLKFLREKKSIGFEKITFTNNISIYSMKTDQKLIVKNTWDILECFTFLDILECSWNFMEHRFSKYCWLIWKNLTSSWDVCSPHVWQRQSAWMTRTFLG